MATTKVCLLENEAEARLLCAILDEKQIPYTLLIAHDSAFDGLYEAQMEWGHIEAPERSSAIILQILQDLRLDRDTKHPSAAAGEVKRPPTISTSIVVVSIFTFFEISVPILLLATGVDSIRDLVVIGRNLAITIIIAAGIVDVWYLLLRRKWTYYLNITLLFIYSAYILLFALLALLDKNVLLAAIWSVLCCLLSWLCAEIIRRKEHLQYLSAIRKHGNRTR